MLLIFLKIEIFLEDLMTIFYCGAILFILTCMCIVYYIVFIQLYGIYIFKTIILQLNTEINRFKIYMYRLCILEKPRKTNFRILRSN